MRDVAVRSAMGRDGAWWNTVEYGIAHVRDPAVRPTPSPVRVESAVAFAVAARRDCREYPIAAPVRATANVRAPQPGPGAWYPRGGAWDPPTFSVPPNANERTRGAQRGVGHRSLRNVKVSL